MSRLSAGTKRRVKRSLAAENPTIWVGKGGVSQDFLKEVGKQLDKREMVKVRILKSALEEGEAKSIAMSAAEQLGASLVEVRGHTFMLFRRRKK